MKKDIIKKVYVNLPLRMVEEYIGKYLQLELNPEFGIDSEALDNLSLEYINQISEKFIEKGLKIKAHGPFFDLNPVSSDEMIREISCKRMYNALEYAKVLKAESIVFHPGYDFKRHDFLKDEWLKKSCDFYAEFSNFASKNNITLLLENVYERNPHEILPLLEAVSSSGGGFCFDLGHHFAFGEDILENWIKQTAKYIKEIHLHDNDGKQDLHLPPGKGKINFDPLKYFIKDNLNKVKITLEPHREEDLFPCFEWLEKNNVF
ncbi:MAG: sugar phosphate isomerase/epimerase family protein [Desulforegulaceae bacterium]|nr:sugar phosphate isomerase/epimerase family protein [Desulforegulaceae bacterium]